MTPSRRVVHKRHPAGEWSTNDTQLGSGPQTDELAEIQTAMFELCEVTKQPCESHLKVCIVQ